MTSKKKQLLEHYTLKDSIKNYKGYKVKPPEETIKNIETAFKKINLKVNYNPNGYSVLKKLYPFQSGKAFLVPIENDEKILLITEGKGVKPKLSQASATAELIERFTGYGLANGNIRGYLSLIKWRGIWEKKREKNSFVEKKFPFQSMDTLDLIPTEHIEKYHNMAKGVCFSLTDKKLFSFPEEFLIKLGGSNGLASGNTLEEAALHAIYELIERLAGMYILDNLPKCDKISKESITHPTLKKLMHEITSCGIEFEILNFSHLFNIPLIVTIFDHPEWNISASKSNTAICNTKYPKMIIGVDSDPQDAALRCFTEFIQGNIPITQGLHLEEQIQDQFNIASLPLSNYISSFYNTIVVWKVNGNIPSSIDIKKYLKNKRYEKSITDIINLYDKNQKIEIERIIEKLKENNIEVFIQDITHPLLKFPVVKAIISGKKNKLSKIPLNGYDYLILGASDQKYRFSVLKEQVDRILGSTHLSEVLKSEKWCIEPNNQELINYVIEDSYIKGPFEKLWGTQINKFYFLGTLYLRIKNYKQAKKCLEAALYQNLNDIPSLIALAYIYSKINNKEKYNDIIEHIDIVCNDQIDINKHFKELEDPIVDPNPFEPCDLQCKNKPYLCEQCFFDNIPEDIFMNKITDDLL